MNDANGLTPSHSPQETPQTFDASTPPAKPEPRHLSALPVLGVFAVVCAWCGKTLSTRAIDGATIVSHGICDECRLKAKPRTLH